MDRRKFIVGSAVSAAVATRPYVAAGQDQPLGGHAQPQPLSFGQAGTSQKWAGISPTSQECFISPRQGLPPLTG
jgi:hypothetical protein